MANKQVFPTKGNLIATKKSNDLAHMGYELMDRKRNILTREMMSLMDDVKLLRDKITITYQKAYYALQQANMSLGVISDLVEAVPVDTGIHISYRSVMGVEIPKVKLHPNPIKPYYGFQSTNAALDNAYVQFQKVKQLTATLAEIENSVYRLANAIKKTQKRANALKNIIIPRFEADSKFIADALEEKEREDFSRLKIIKKNR